MQEIEFEHYAWCFPSINLVYERYLQFLKYKLNIETRFNIGLQSTENVYGCGVSAITQSVRGNVSVVGQNDEEAVQ